MIRRAIAAGALAAAALAAAGCGKKGPPLPPLRVRPAPVEGLRVVQRGATLVVSLQEPKRRTDGSEFEEEVVLRIKAVPEDPLASGPRGARRRARRAAAEAVLASWSFPRAEWPLHRVEKRLEVALPLHDLKLGQQAAAAGARKVAFVAEVQEGKRKRSVPTAPLLVGLCVPPASPASLAAMLAPSGVALSWSGEARPPGAVHIYRAEGDAPYRDLPHRALPASATSWLDEAVAPGTTYRYRVRFGAGEDPRRCESDPSPEAMVRYEDVFPPAPPAGLAAAAEESLIRLFWTPSAEPDLAGYHVYRADGADAPFRRLTAEPVTSSTYADTDVQRGRRYTYAVSAVDTARPPNESGRSEPAEEALP